MSEKNEIEIKLKDFILSKYKSIRIFSKESNIPYTTIVSILERGINRASINTIMQICDFLNIDIDMLVNKEIVEKNTINDEYIKSITLKIGKLNNEGKRKIDEYINDLLKIYRNKERK